MWLQGFLTYIKIVHGIFAKLAAFGRNGLFHLDVIFVLYSVSVAFLSSACTAFQEEHVSLWYIEKTI